MLGGFCVKAFAAKGMYLTFTITKYVIQFTLFFRITDAHVILKGPTRGDGRIFEHEYICNQKSFSLIIMVMFRVKDLLLKNYQQC